MCADHEASSPRAAVPMHPGVHVILNDPFAGGTHLPDLTLVTPVFLDGETIHARQLIVAGGRWAARAMRPWLERLLGHALDRVELELPEIQAATTREVALEKAAAAYAALRRPVIIEDAGLEFSALGGFPGPFIKFWEKLGGLSSICRALDGGGDRRATAVCVLAWAEGEHVEAVEGRVAGTISHRLSGTLAERQIRAKTGTLSGTSSLAGYAGWPNRPPLAFAIFVNGLGEGATSQARTALAGTRSSSPTGRRGRSAS